MTVQRPNLRFTLAEILFAVLAWSLLILRFGYRFGTGDQVELLPYVLYLHDHSLYARDFFLQGLHASVPNERTIMANLLLPFVSQLEFICFLFQFLSSVILILGLSRLAQRFIQNRYIAWLSVLIALIPLNDFALGNVELYSECFQASGLSVAIVVWALLFFLDKKYLVAVSLLSVATFIQLLDGLDVTLVLTAVLFISVLRKEESLSVLLKFVAVYAFTAGVYLILIYARKNTASGISNEQLFSILFEFRHPHHFIFSSFPKGRMFVFFLLAGIGIVYFRKRSPVLLRFFLVASLGLLVYAVSTDVFHFVFIGNFQLYKVTPWLKFLSIVAVLGFAELKLGSPLASEIPWEKPLLIVGSLFCWVVIICFHQQLPYRVPFEIFQLKQDEDIISICKEINEKTAKDALFIQPFENTELKFYAQRSSYVEFKANVKNKKFILEWWRRLESVYQISLSDKRQGFAAQAKADENFYHLSAEKLSELKQEGVTHILTHKEFPPSKGSLILQNNTYAVYQL